MIAKDGEQRDAVKERLSERKWEDIEGEEKWRWGRKDKRKEMGRGRILSRMRKSWLETSSTLVAQYKILCACSYNISVFFSIFLFISFSLSISLSHLTLFFLPHHLQFSMCCLHKVFFFQLPLRLSSSFRFKQYSLLIPYFIFVHYKGYDSSRFFSTVECWVNKRKKYLVIPHLPTFRVFSRSFSPLSEREKINKFT